MSNIYLKDTVEKNWRSQNYEFLNLKHLSSGQFLGSSRSHKYHWILTQVWEQKCVWLFYNFNFERNYDVFKSKNPCFLLKKNINFYKNETKSTMEDPTHTFRETNLVFQLIKESRAKVNLWWVGARERKKITFFITLILSDWNFFIICILS